MARYISIEINNERLNCMVKSSFLQNISGLGFANEYEFVSPVNGFFYKTLNRHTQKTISGDLVFINRGTQYSDYRDFMSALNQSDEVKFIYRPFGSQEYYADVLVVSVEKGEINQEGYLECPIKFVSLTPFYTTADSPVPFPNTNAGTSKTYSYEYSYGYSTSRTAGAVDIEVGGDYDGSVDFEIINYIASPVLTIQSANSDKVYSVIDLTGITIEDGESLIYSSVPNKSGIWRKNNATGSLTSLIDFVTLHEGIDLFPQLPKNTGMTAILQGTKGDDTRASIQTYRYYKTR